MKARHTFLIFRAAAFAVLLGTAGVTSISVAASAQDARQVSLVSTAKAADLARAETPTAGAGIDAAF